jgi:SAM-dependent methyltransferase
MSGRGTEEFRVLAIDRDPRALDYAARVAEEANAQIELCCADVLRFTTTESFDLIWAAGLFDYLSDALFIRLMKRFGRALAPGAEMVIGNFCGDHASQNYMELVGDWSLHYRSAEELSRIASRAGFQPDCVRIGSEPEGINLFLHVTKR